MAHFQFKGEIENISPRQLEFISSILEDRGFNTCEVHVETVGKAGDNYAANVKRIVVNEQVPFKMIAKIAPSDELARQSMNAAWMFKKESFMYTKVLSKFAELENKAYLPQKDKLRFATCYGSLLEETNEMILLEDLTMADFIILQNCKRFTSDTVKLVLRNFAILHSLSFILKNQEPETFDNFCKDLDALSVNKSVLIGMQECMKQMEDELISILDNEQYKSLMENFISQTIKNSMKFASVHIETNQFVIQQGDSWINNIMFKMKGDEAQECCMIDYQLSRRNSPVADILYMIFSCTDYETRSKFYHEWIAYYYNELDNHLSKFGLKANQFYARDKFDADISGQAKVYFGQSVMAILILMREHHEAANAKAVYEKSHKLKDMLSITQLGEKSRAKFKERVEGLIKTFIDFGYF